MTEILKTELNEMLAERERRVLRQQELLKEYRLPVVSVSMNIAGDVKSTPGIEFVFEQGLKIFENAVKVSPLKKETVKGAAGPHALYVFDLPAEEIKNTAVEVEESGNRTGEKLGPCGRLFDFDVINEKGEKLSRPAARRCLVCGGPVSICSRSRAHGLSAIREVTEGLLREYMAAYFSEMAAESLKEEALLTPKPGLVDSNNNGAHKDMNVRMFLDSAEVLSAHFHRFFVIGAQKDDCIAELTEEGIRAEEDMFLATGGVNTHRGSVFSMSLFLAALGAYMMRGGDIRARIIALAEAKKEKGIPQNTHKGGMALKQAEEAFPSAFKAAQLLAQSTAFRALCSIMAELEDSNLIYRGGSASLLYVKQEAEIILQLKDDEIPQKFIELDAECIKKGISPGGAADMLALAMFINKLGDHLSILS